MVHKVILIGNLGQDTEVKYTQSGTAVAALSVATTRGVKKGDKWENETEWHRVQVWAKSAEYCGKYLQKGSKVYVEGRLQTRQWEKDGEKRYTTEVVASTVQNLSPRNSESGQGGYDESPLPGYGSRDEDVPF